MSWIAVALGGALGSLARHGVNLATVQAFGRSAPYATFVVNMSGSFLIGVLAGLVGASRWAPAPTLRLFVFVGLLGGYTTFSSYMLDALLLTQTGRVGLALLTVAGQVVLGYALAYLGYRLSTS
jgi:fluoride exporter